MTLEILICTMEGRLEQVSQMLLPVHEGIRYLVSCQYQQYEPSVPQELRLRGDVKVVFLKGRGLSHNRNNALQHAINDILLIADDDGRFYAGGLEEIIHTYEHHPEVDIALFQVDGMSKYYPDEPFRLTEKDFAGPYGTASVEITLRRASLGMLRFNPHFGLGSDYLSAGEEQVFLYDALHRDMNVTYFPIKIASTSPCTTGERFLSDASVQRSKGATFCYLFGRRKAMLMCLKESLHYFVYKFVNPIRLMYNMNHGIHYVVNQKLCRR